MSTNPTCFPSERHPRPISMQPTQQHNEAKIRCTPYLATHIKRLNEEIYNQKYS